MIKAIVDENKVVRVETKMSDEFNKEDSIIDGVIVCSTIIQDVVLEIIRKFYEEIEDLMLPVMTDDMKKLLLDSTLQIVSEKINMDGYKDFIARRNERGDLDDSNT